MNSPIRVGLTVLLTSALTIFSGCSSTNDPAPAQANPSPFLNATMVNSPSLAEAQSWFAKASQQSTKAIAIDWQEASSTGSWIIAPVTETRDLFNQSTTQGFRYLVVQAQSNGAINGRIIELLLPSKTLSATQAATFALQGVQPITGAKAPVNLSGFTGCLLVYSPTYKYQTGLLYKNGIVQTQRIKLVSKNTRTATAAARAGSTISIPVSGPVSNLLMVRVCETISVETTTVDGTVLGGYTTTSCTTVYVEEGGGGTGSSSGWGDGGSEGGGTGGEDTGGSEGGSTGCRCPGYTPPPPPPPIEYLIETRDLPPCAQSIMQGIVSNGVTLSSQLAPYFGAKLKFYPRIHMDAIPDNKERRVAGNTIRAAGEILDKTYGLPIYEITINSGQLYGDTHGEGATNMGVAATMLHELTHAYLIEWSKGAALDPNASLDILLQNYTKKVKSTESEQHDLMSKIVTVLGQQLYAYCNGAGIRTDLTYCTNLMWSGLTGTDKYKSMTDEQKVLIENISGMENYNMPTNNGRDAEGSTILKNPTGSKACQ